MNNFFRVRLPVALYCLVAISCMFQGVRYLLAVEIMPYHLDVVGVGWESVNPSYQTLMLGLLKGFGAGSFSVGLAVAFLAWVPLRAGRRWARWSTPAVAASYAGALVYVTRFALLPDAAPISVSSIVLGLVALAAASSLLTRDPKASR